MLFFPYKECERPNSGPLQAQILKSLTSWSCSTFCWIQPCLTRLPRFSVLISVLPLEEMSDLGQTNSVSVPPEMPERGPAPSDTAFSHPRPGNLSPKTSPKGIRPVLDHQWRLKGGRGCTRRDTDSLARSERGSGWVGEWDTLSGFPISQRRKVRKPSAQGTRWLCGEGDSATQFPSLPVPNPRTAPGRHLCLPLQPTESRAQSMRAY